MPLEIFLKPGESQEQSMALLESDLEASGGRPVHISALEPLTNQSVTCWVHDTSIISITSDFPLVGVPAGYAVEPAPGGPVPSLYTIMVELDTYQNEPLELSLRRSLSSSLDRAQVSRVFKEVRLKAMLGKGSIGGAFRAVWRGLDVAVKVIEWLQPAHLQAEHGEIARQAGMAVIITHPNLIRTYDFSMRRRRGVLKKHVSLSSKEDFHNEEAEVITRSSRSSEDKNDPTAAKPMEAWIVMELATMGSLVDANERGWLRPTNALREQTDAPPDMVATISTALEIAKGMAHLHKLGVVHGNLTASSILLYPEPYDPRGFIAKVSDFGMKRAHGMSAGGRDSRILREMSAEELVQGKAADVQAFEPSQLQQGLRVKLPLPKSAPDAYQELTGACLDASPQAYLAFADQVEQLNLMLASARKDASASSL
ncbi:hypothetical protein WJX73_003805 [Symbiochloris irregularis]|uniref:Protein kinase domain-containing protein n=1 Tax=Symbiochloris irregularis TaxID=706552 RepID=A0AAW1PSM6_9CHLO